jgi:heat-inducible transcriptional repressor
MKEHDSRSREILDAVVRLHIETGRPVSSALVARALGGRFCAATIRSVMKGLEADGLLEQPHTSAGRLPTDTGFRSFVDRVLVGWSLRERDLPRPLRLRVEERLRRSAGSHTLGKVLANLLNQLTANIGIVLDSGWDGVRAQRVDLFPKEAGRVLMVLVLENAFVRTLVVTPQRTYPPAVLELAASVLSERVAGRTVGELRRGLIPSLNAATDPTAACARELAWEGREIFDEFDDRELELTGVADVLDQPEFSQPEPLKALIRFIESPRTIRETLARLDAESFDPFGVWIGGENPRDELRQFGLILHRYELEGRPGLMAVLGPRRMPYHRAFTGIDVLQRSLQNLS